MATKVCSVCHATKFNIDFSGAQLKQKANKRKCKNCVEAVSIDKYKELLSWLGVSPHGKISAVNIVELGPEFRGVKANRDFKAGDVIIKIAESHMMTYDNALTQPDIQSLVSTNKLSLDDHHSVLALFLLAERSKGSASFWYPYISLLPVNYTTVPLFFDLEDIHRLYGSTSSDMIAVRLKSLEDDWDKIKESLKSTTSTSPLSSCTFEDFTWARVVVISRIFGYEIKGRKTEALVPLADMLNHSESPGTCWKFNETDRCFQIDAERRIYSGNNIMDTYGPKCNKRYFVNYGFTLPDNEIWNQASLYFNLDRVMELQHDDKDTQMIKRLILGKQGRSIDDGYSGYSIMVAQGLEQRVTTDGLFRFEVPTTMRADSLVDTLFSFARTLVANKDELTHITEVLKRDDPRQNHHHNQYLGFKLSVINERNERAVLALIACEARNRLTDFLTSMEDDIHSLSNAVLYSNEYNITNILVSEKQVLQHYIDLDKLVTSMSTIRLARRALLMNKTTREYGRNTWAHMHE